MTDTIRDTPDSFGIGATFGGEYLPRTHVEAMTRGEAHRVPLIIGSNATEASLFARFMDYLPTNESVIEKFLAAAEPAVAPTLRAAYPGYPNQGGLPGVRQRLHLRREGLGARRGARVHAPTYHYRYDYAPRSLQWTGFGATHATELLAVFDVYETRLGGAADRGGRPALGAPRQPGRPAPVAVVQSLRGAG